MPQNNMTSRTNEFKTTFEKRVHNAKMAVRNAYAKRADNQKKANAEFFRQAARFSNVSKTRKNKSRKNKTRKNNRK
jgi:hypothetical protein